MKIKGRSTRKHWERKPLITEEPGCLGTPLCVSRGFVWTTQQQRTTRQIRDLFAIVEWPRKRPLLTILTIARCGEGISKTPGQRFRHGIVAHTIVNHTCQRIPTLIACVHSASTNRIAGLRLKWTGQETSPLSQK